MSNLSYTVFLKFTTFHEFTLEINKNKALFHKEGRTKSRFLDSLNFGFLLRVETRQYLYSDSYWPKAYCIKDKKEFREHDLFFCRIKTNQQSFEQSNVKFAISAKKRYQRNIFLILRRYYNIQWPQSYFFDHDIYMSHLLS